MEVCNGWCMRKAKKSCAFRTALHEGMQIFCGFKLCPECGMPQCMVAAGRPSSIDFPDMHMDGPDAAILGAPEGVVVPHGDHLDNHIITSVSCNIDIASIEPCDIDVCAENGVTQQQAEDACAVMLNYNSIACDYNDCVQYAAWHFIRARAP